MISLQKQFIFVHSPKTAGNSIQRALAPYSEDEIIKNHPLHDGIERFELHSQYTSSGKHAFLREYKTYMDPTLYNGLYKVCCARNPWDRAISYYFHFNGPGRGFVTRPVDRDASPWGKDPDDPRFTYWDRRRFIEATSNHLPSLFAHIYTGNDRRLDGSFDPLNEVDRIMRFENLTSDFSDVCRGLDIPVPELPHVNRSPREHYSIYYDDELIDKVARLYALEIDYFNYSFERA